ncbi:hypothetical protein A8C32_11615 [Flavivirga aquatica]|uniref:DUF4190 domain-containing protein n=1 Tax=Flavivirga aquatica TaxID=1849968 RepID=A0A1E5TDC4_9FLAO|nr:CCC motif membrane protein [Flavivirga aquatica]OEK09361.1 hypothetical protein A8C32_11615 [Flavivirga aquatica]
MNQSKLSADPLALILGIIALVISFVGCCCYGILAFIPLIIGIIGLVSANISLKEYASNPEAYSAQTKSNVSTAKILNIIAVVFSGVTFLWGIGVLVFYGTMLSSGILDKFNSFDKFETYKYENDTIFNDSEYYKEVEQDSIILDSFDLQTNIKENSN